MESERVVRALSLLLVPLNHMLSKYLKRQGTDKSRRSAGFGVNWAFWSGCKDVDSCRILIHVGEPLIFVGLISG